MYKFCFKLENDNRTWLLACKSEQDLFQWYNAIQIQIEQINRRIAIEKVNNKITEKEKDKSQVDAEVMKTLVVGFKDIMFHPLLKSMLIGYLTQRDHYLNRIIPLLLVYLDQSKNCYRNLAQLQQSAGDATEMEIRAVQRLFDQTFEMAANIVKELRQIQSQFATVHSQQA